jgi:hypothetical protein
MSINSPRNSVEAIGGEGLIETARFLLFEVEGDVKDLLVEAIAGGGFLEAARFLLVEAACFLLVEAARFLLVEAEPPLDDDAHKYL